MEIVRIKERSVMGKESKVHETKAKELNVRPVLPSKHDPATAKLKQALDKIDEQGRRINALIDKLQECTDSIKAAQQASSHSPLSKDL
jgi:ferritin-like metal-binding protein YciE